MLRTGEYFIVFVGLDEDTCIILKISTVLTYKYMGVSYVVVNVL